SGSIAAHRPPRPIARAPRRRPRPRRSPRRARCPAAGWSWTSRSEARARRGSRGLRGRREPRRNPTAVSPGSCNYDGVFRDDWQPILRRICCESGTDADTTTDRPVSGDMLRKPQTETGALDGTDRAILAALLADGRITNAALAAHVGV